MTKNKLVVTPKTQSLQPPILEFLASNGFCGLHVVFTETVAEVIGPWGWNGFYGMGWQFIMLFMVFCGRLAMVWVGRFAKTPKDLLT
jgi:hypothetical protein